MEQCYWRGGLLGWSSQVSTYSSHSHGVLGRMDPSIHFHDPRGKKTTSHHLATQKHKCPMFQLYHQGVVRVDTPQKSNIDTKHCNV